MSVTGCVDAVLPWGQRNKEVSMEYSLKNSMVIGVSARALFDMRKDNGLFEEQGLDAYSAYQKVHEDEFL